MTYSTAQDTTPIRKSRPSLDGNTPSEINAVTARAWSAITFKDTSVFGFSLYLLQRVLVSLHDWENQICFKVCFAMLQYRGQSFKTCANMMFLCCNGSIGTVWHFIELSEHEVPNFKVTVTVTTRCTVRIITTMFRALVEEDFAIWTTWAFTDSQKLSSRCNVAFFYATIVVPCIICFLVIWIYSDI